MVQTAADLQQMKGVGVILAKRLSDAGFDSFARIVQAGEEGLKKVPGISPGSIASIVEQAKQLAQLNREDHPSKREQALKSHLLEVRQRVEAVAQATRDRFQQDLAGRQGKKLSADLIRIEDALARMDRAGKKRFKRADRALSKAGKRVAGLEDASLKKVRKGLKRARKVVLKGVR